MKIYTKSKNHNKGKESSLPNVFAYTFIRNFLTDKKYEETREDYFIGDLNNKQVNQVMNDIKWLCKNYKDLNVITIEDYDANITKIIL